MIELTPEQQQALDASPAIPPVLVDPRTEEKYILVKASDFAQTHPRAEYEPPLESLMSEGIRLARAAIRRDLPAMLAERRTRGKWAGYGRDTRVIVDKNYEKVLNECFRRGYRDDEIMVIKVEPDAINDDFEVDRTFVEFDDDDAPAGN